MRGLAAAGQGGALLVWTDREIAFLDPLTGAMRSRAAAPFGPVEAAVAQPEVPGGGASTIAAATGRDPAVGHLLFADAPGAPVAVRLPAAAERVALDPLAPRAIFWSPSGAATVVDVATAAPVGAVALRDGIGAVAFAGEAAFFLTPDQSAVAVLDLAALAPGKAPELREVRLGPRGTAATDAGGLLVPLDPSPQAMAVNAETFTAFVIDESSRMGDAPPMTAVRLRGGRPVRLAVIDRSFREAEPGRFRARAIVPAPGPHELVLTTGIGGMSTCFPIAVGSGPDAVTKAAPPAAPRVTLTPEAPLRVGTEGWVTVALNDEEGRPIPSRGLRLSAVLLDMGWRTPLGARGDGGGRTGFRAAFPLPGVYVIELRGLPGRPPATATLEVLP